MAARAVRELEVTQTTLIVEQSLRTSCKQRAALKLWAIVSIQDTQRWVQAFDGDDDKREGGEERGGGKGGGGGAGGQLGGREAV